MMTIEGFEKKWQKMFDGMAKSGIKDFEKSIWTEHGAEGHERYFFHHFDNLKLKKGAKILDVGCGPGTYTQVLSDRGFKVCGIDFSKEMIKIAKKRDSLHRITYKQSSIYNLSFPNDYFDTVICIGVLQTTQNYKKALNELYRVTKPGGNFYLDALNKNSIKHALGKDKQKLKRYYYSELSESCKRIGFSSVKVKGIYYFHSRLKILENFIIDMKIHKILDTFLFLSQYGVNSFILTGKK